MGKAKTDMREILATASNNRVTAIILELTDKLNERLAESKALGRSPDELSKIRQKGKEEITKATLSLADSEAKRIAGELDKRRREYLDDREKHTAKRALELEEARTRFGAMGDDELKAELERISTADFITDSPIIVDELFRTAKSAGIDAAERDAYRTLVIEKNYREPWTQNAEARGLQAELKVYAETKPYTVPVVSRDGSTTRTAAISVDDLLTGGDR